MYKKLLVLISLLLFGLNMDSNAQLPYPLPAPRDTSYFGKYIQRTMKLLASSTPTNKNTVKILVYGQSISEQAWSDTVKRFLTTKFPNANLIMINRALGGYASQELKKPTYLDIPTFYPDLVIFHVYGSHYDLDSIMNTIRRTTTAEVLIANSHGDSLSGGWENTYGYTHIPNIANKYGLEFGNIRSMWTRYLRQTGRTEGQLTSDGTHLNDHGNFLMARLVNRYLAPNNKYKADTFEMVKTYLVGTDVNWVNGKITLPFKGNRVDIIADAPVANMDSALIKIDNKKPSDFPETRMFYRPNVPFNESWKIATPWNNGGPIKISRGAPLLDETWTLTITGKTSVSGGTKIDFSVGGSKTGFDGSGSFTHNSGFSGNKFVSNSGRVIINPTDWWFFFNASDYWVGKTYSWPVLRFFKDSYVPPTTVTSNIETNVTVAQGIPNGAHTLEITAQGNKNVPIKAIRVYYPVLGRNTTPNLSTATVPSIVCVNNPLDLSKSYIDLGSTTGVTEYFIDPQLTQKLENPNSVTASGVYFIKKTPFLTNNGISVPVTVISKICIPEFDVPSIKKVCYPNTINVIEDLVTITNGAIISNYGVYSDVSATQIVPNYESLSDPGTYYIKLVSDSNYVTIKSTEIQFEDCVSASITSDNVKTINVSPNPSNGIFKINGDFTNTLQAEVVDIYGNKILEKPLNKNSEINLSQNAKGIYFLKISAGQQQLTLKLIVN